MVVKRIKGQPATPEQEAKFMSGESIPSRVTSRRESVQRAQLRRSYEWPTNESWKAMPPEQQVTVALRLLRQAVTQEERVKPFSLAIEDALRYADAALHEVPPQVPEEDA